MKLFFIYFSLACSYSPTRMFLSKQILLILDDPCRHFSPLLVTNYLMAFWCFGQLKKERNISDLPSTAVVVHVVVVRMKYWICLFHFIPSGMIGKRLIFSNVKLCRDPLEDVGLWDDECQEHKGRHHHWVGISDGRHDYPSIRPKLLQLAAANFNERRLHDEIWKKRSRRSFVWTWTATGYTFPFGFYWIIRAMSAVGGGVTTPPPALLLPSSCFVLPLVFFFFCCFGSSRFHPIAVGPTEFWSRELYSSPEMFSDSGCCLLLLHDWIM